MKNPSAFKCIFVDIGGVLLSDGWGYIRRKRAAKKFNLNQEELETRHKLNFETYEEGKLTLREYLKRVIFYQKRSFNLSQFRQFIFNQTESYPEMIELVSLLKIQYGFKIAALSNEGRELNDYRIHKFKLDQFIDFFISSCLVHLRKPDRDIFKMALDIAHVRPDQAIYIENTPLFVEVAEGMGIESILHTDYKSTRAKLASFGLRIDNKVLNDAN